jgi:hypothetical protein
MTAPPRWTRTSALPISDGEPESARVEGADLGRVIDPAAADAPKLVVVDVRALGDEQDQSGVVDVEFDGDLAGLDVWQELVEQHSSAAGAGVEARASVQAPSLRIERW